MVSWFRAFHLRWKGFVKEFGPTALEVIRSSQITFGLISPKDATFEGALEQWFETFQERGEAGVFFVAKRGDLEGDPVSIVAVHHLLVLEGSAAPDIVGIEAFDATAIFKGLNSVELFGKLTPHRGAKKAGASDFFVPTLDGLIDGLHPVTGKFVPGAKEACLTIQTLESKINGVLVPVPIAQLLLGEEVDLEDSVDDDESGDDAYDQTNPLHLLKRLIRVMKYKREKESGWYKNWKPIAEEVVTLLWAAANGFAIGVNILPVKATRQILRHQVNCAQELISSDMELYGETDDSVGESKRNEEDAHDYSNRGTPRPAGQLLGLELTAVRSPLSKGTASPISRKERAGVSFETPPFSFGEEKEEPPGESKYPEVEEVPGGSRASGESAVPGPPNLPDWAGQMAGQFMAGFLATTKALTEAGVQLNELARVNKKSLDDKEETKLATSKWLKSGEFLLKVLSAEDGWNTTGVPELTEFAQSLIKMKLFSATQHIRALAQEQEWPGGLLKSGVSEFLKRGFATENVHSGPSGFSVLFFHPSSFTETDGDEFGIQQLRESFGDGKLPEEMMKSFSKLNIFVPKNTYEAAEQVDTAVRFLKCLCGENTIATGGYSVGLQYLTRSRPLFEAKDRLFLVNYLYMLDRVFQSFCGELKKYIQEDDPIQVAKLTGAQRWMEKLVETPIQTWKVAGTVPMYSAPTAWDERKLGDGVVDLNGGKTRSAANPGVGGSASPPAKKKRAEKSTGDEKELPWHKSLDQSEYVKEWFVPSPNRFFQYFSPEKPENFIGLPMVTHHRSGRKAYICVRYIVGNGPGCSRGLYCTRSHIKMSDLSPEEKDQITSHMKEVYEGKKKPT